MKAKMIDFSNPVYVTPSDGRRKFHIDDARVKKLKLELNVFPDVVVVTQQGKVCLVVPMTNVASWVPVDGDLDPGVFAPAGVDLDVVEAGLNKKKSK